MAPRLVWGGLILVLAVFGWYALHGEIPYQDKFLDKEVVIGNSTSIVIPQISEKEFDDMTATEQAVFLANRATIMATKSTELRKSADTLADELEDLWTEDARDETDMDDLRVVRRDARDKKANVEQIVKDIDSLRKKVKSDRDDVRTIAGFREVNETNTEWQNKQNAESAADDALTEVDLAVDDVKDPEKRALAAYNLIDDRYANLTKPAPDAAATAPVENKTVIQYVYVPQNYTVPAETESVPLVESNLADNTPLSMESIAAGTTGGNPAAPAARSGTLSMEAIAAGQA